VIASASERLLEENAFYMRLKLIAGERMAELNRLQGKIATQRQELEALKIRCDTYQCVHPGYIYDFLY
jgi:predicted DNA-binding ribbon-helix-helix protein